MGDAVWRAEDERRTKRHSFNRKRGDSGDLERTETGGEGQRVLECYDTDRLVSSWVLCTLLV